MPPIQLNRRRFLGCSAAAGWAISQATAVAAGSAGLAVRVGFIGLGNRGTNLLRAALEMESVEVVSVCDGDGKHLARAAGIVEKARGRRPDATESADRLLERPEIDAVVVALPCDLHAGVYDKAMRAGKHLYAEKPLGLTLGECDRLIAEASRRPEQVFHVGYQRRSNPRYRDAIAAIHRGDLGPLVSGSAAWISSNGPINGHEGWLSRRERSGDWMVEQAVHVWDVFHWVARGVPQQAFGSGRRDVFARVQPDRDMTDDYQAQLQWADGFAVNFVQSWVAPADDGFTGISQRLIGIDGGFDFATGAMTFRDRKRPRQIIHPGVQPDTSLSIRAFIDEVRSPERGVPPVSLREARDATVTGLMVRRAVDENRVVKRSEIEVATPS
jgi:myo-inositol 2-dehydrogenase/D-chiro-inositol 1-dehydrogenase